MIRKLCDALFLWYGRRTGKFNVEMPAIFMDTAFDRQVWRGEAKGEMTVMHHRGMFTVWNRRLNNTEIAELLHQRRLHATVPKG